MEWKDTRLWERFYRDQNPVGAFTIFISKHWKEIPEEEYLEYFASREPDQTFIDLVRKYYNMKLKEQIFELWENV